MLPILLRHSARRPEHAKSLLRLYTSNSHGSSSGSGCKTGWRYAAAAAAVGAAGLLSYDLVPIAYGDAAYSAPVPGDVLRKQFQEWMGANGADWSAAEVQPSKDPESGLGLTATPALRHHMSHRWLGRRVGSFLLRGMSHQTVPVATIPLNLALTAESARQDPELGSVYGELLEIGALDERSVVIVMLLVEKLKGQGSRWAPYINLLPEKFNSPLWFTEEQLAELAGTTLAAATAARQASLSRSWDRLKPAVTSMLQQVGVFAAPTFDDFCWASSVFWSRGLGLPVPIERHFPDGDVQVRIEVQEGLVPGLDFANHSQQPRCWWEVIEQQQQGSATEVDQPAQAATTAGLGRTHAVQMLTNRACCPKSGEELTISYGDKGNEELLLLYGFTQFNNPHETLMLLCPLPPADEWDQVFAARMQLLQARGLTPQLFLSASHLTNYQQAEAAAVAKSGSSSSSSRGSRARDSSILPAAARDVLEVFVMQKSELFDQLQALGGIDTEQQQQQQQQQQGSLPSAAAESTEKNDGNSSSKDDVEARGEQLGMSMAVLTTLVRLLELKLIQMEGDEGTGPLEDDLRRLAEAAAAAQEAHKSGHAPAAAADMPLWLRHCLQYRAGQKALVREYLTAARKELQDTLAELQALMEASGEYQE